MRAFNHGNCVTVKGRSCPLSNGKCPGSWPQPFAHPFSPARGLQVPNPSHRTHGKGTRLQVITHPGSESVGQPKGFGSSKYGQVSANVMSLGNELRQLGVSNEIKLPTLVTAGNQSSGKSSVVEAIAAIPLPRSSGTCTRCPTEVRMSQAKPASALSKTGWLCRIKLKREFNANDERLAEVPPEEHFCTITRKDDVTACVTAAQAALLNPTALEREGSRAFCPEIDITDGDASPKHSSALAALGDSQYELEFTRNSVVLEIEGAEADLTIVDLPGIIQSHPKGQQYVDMIKRMVVKNVEQQHVIIVMVLTAMDDIENQAINMEARQVDPKGERTIGVITKPDNISRGDHSKWISLARNQNPNHSLALGYYVVRNPDQDELNAGVTYHEARQLETVFFTKPDSHWSDVAADAGGRLGTTNLRNALSEMLSKRIMSELPRMRNDAMAQLKDIDEKLGRLPPKPSDDLEYEFTEMLQQVAEELSEQVHGSSAGDKSFYRGLQAIYEGFAEELHDTMPVFEVNKKIIDMQDSFYEDLGEKAFEDLYSGQLTTLEQVAELHARHLGRELPSFSPYSAVEELIAKYKGKWKEAMLTCLEEATQQLQVVVDKEIKERFGRFPDMLPLLSAVMASHLETEAAACKEHLARLLDMEQHDTFTMNTSEFSECKAEFLARLKEACLERSRADTRIKVAKNDPKLTEAGLMAYLKTFGLQFQKVEDLFLAQATSSEAELNIMAATLAYFKVSYKRVLDEVPMHVRHMLRTFADKQQLPRTIHSMIKADMMGKDVTELLREDAAIDNKRRQLTDTRSRLKQALAKLQQPTIGALRA